MEQARWYVILLLVLIASGCRPHDDQPQPAGQPATLSAPYRVVTTTAMVTDIVRAVVGSHGEVVGLMGEGVDPHLYKATRNDIKQLMDADVIFYSGLMLEGRMSDAFARAQRSGTPAFPVTEGIAPEYLLEPPEFAGHWDPHVWIDVAAWSQCVEYVAAQLAELDPAHADDYQANAAAYRNQLTELDEYVRQVIASIPEPQRLLITAHDAFGYFSRAYDIPVHSVQGISTEAEASVNDINQLVELLVSRKIQAVFAETSVSDRNLRAVIEGAASGGWTVRIGGSLFSDATGRPGTYEGTYIGMMDHNATVIARSLGGEAPRRGLHGKLASDGEREGGTR